MNNVNNIMTNITTSNTGTKQKVKKTAQRRKGLLTLHSSLFTLHSSLFTLLLLLFMGVSNPAWGQDPEKWDGSAKSSSLTGKGTEAEPYQINSAADLVYFLGQSDKTWWVKLNTDIDLNNHPWPHINKNFKGHFDGRKSDGSGNHKITNFTLTVASPSTNYGLFGTIQGTLASNKAEVKNLDIEGVTFHVTGSTTNTTRFGGLTGYAKQSVIQNVNVKTVSVTFDGTAPNECNIGGLVGCVVNDQTITDCTVNGYTHTVAGAATKTCSGGLFGRAESYNINISGNTVSNVSITMSGIAKDHRLGGLGGYVYNTEPTKPTVPNKVSKNTVSTVNIAVNNKNQAIIYLGGLVGYAQGKGLNNGRTILEANTVSNPTLTMTGVVGDGGNYYLYMGGLTGYLQTYSSAFNNKIVNPVLSVKDDLKTHTYIAGGIGFYQGYSTVDGLYINGGSIKGPSSQKNITTGKEVYVGGAIGKKGQGGTAASQQSIAKNIAVENMSIDLGNYVHSEGKIANMRFYAGGVIGYLESPKIDNTKKSGIPENLVSKGLKIYAPMALVGATIASTGTIGYENYLISKSTYFDDIEKSKTGSWVYSDFYVGLSQAFMNNANILDFDSDETPATTKLRCNFKKSEAAEVTGGATGIKYISADKFRRTNKYYDNEADCKTVLWWTRTDGSAWANNKAEQSIYPQTSNGTTGTLTTYPYLLYFLQGVAHGTSVTDTEAGNIISGIDKNITNAATASPVTVTITDPQEKQRGFGDHNLEAKVTQVVDGKETDVTSSYTFEWYVNGASATSTVKPDWRYGKNITVYAKSGENVVASASYTLKHTVLATKDSSTEVGAAQSARGTAENPYLIDCKDALLMFSHLSNLSNNYRWEIETDANQTSTHYNQAYYELTTDIDLEGAEFRPISAAGTTSTAYGTYNQNCVFAGHFDGKGHKISNFKITWAGGGYNGGANQYYGLFGAVGYGASSVTGTCVIQNLVIDEAQLVHDDTNTSFCYNNAQTTNKNNVYLGVLAGVVSSRTTIQNIEVRNSSITDGNGAHPDYNIAGQWLCAGGIVGRVQYSAANATYTDLANSITLRFLSSDCDIDLTHAKFTGAGGTFQSNAQMRLFNIGGVVGHINNDKGTYATLNMPEYAYFTGNIKSQNAIVGPVFASVDYTGLGANYSDYWKHYMAKTTTAAQEIPNLYFGKYQIQTYISSGESDVKIITDTDPTSVCTDGSRTITAHANNAHPNTNAFYTNDNYYGEYQGVNYGEYVDVSSADIKTNIEDAFSLGQAAAENNEGITGLFFVFDNEGRLILTNQVPMKVLFADANYSDQSVASHKLTVAGTINKDDYTYKWYNNGVCVATTTDADYKTFDLGVTPQLVYVEIYENANLETPVYTTEVIDIPRVKSLLEADYAPKRKIDLDGAAFNGVFTVTPDAIFTATGNGIEMSYEWKEWQKGTTTENTYTAETAAAENAKHLVADSDGRNPGDAGYVTTYEKTLITDVYGKDPGDDGYVDTYTTYTPVQAGDKYYTATDAKWIAFSGGTTADAATSTTMGATEGKTYKCIITATDTKWQTFLTNFASDEHFTAALKNKYSATLLTDVIVKLMSEKVIFLHPTQSDETFGSVTIPAGNDNWNGIPDGHELGDQSYPVRTWGKAYSLLDGDAGATWDFNTIVLVGTSDTNTTWGINSSNEMCFAPSTDSEYGLSNVFVNGTTNEVTHPKYDEYIAKIAKSPMGKNVTITGKYNNVDYNAMIKSPQIGSSNRKFLNFYGNTKFENLTFDGTGTTKYDAIFGHYHDLWFGEGLIMKNFQADDKEYGTIAGVKTPRLQIFGGMTGDCRFTNQYDAKTGELDKMVQKTVPNGEKGFTLTFRSGYYSIICVGSRQTDGTPGTQGSPNRPIKCTIDVDLDQAWNNHADHPQTMPDGTSTTPYDIALIMAGNHEGAMYADVDINVKSGRIARIVNGSLGARSTSTFKYGTEKKNYPLNTFMGRANILLDPANSIFASDGEKVNPTVDTHKRVIVTELYNGGVGRSRNGEGEIDMPSLGKNTVTMLGGTIGIPEGVTLNMTQVFCGIYGGGAGGANGIGYGEASDKTHTSEQYLPYWDTDDHKAVLYGNYSVYKSATGSRHVTFKCYNADTKDYTLLDPLDTSSEITIKGGVIGSESNPANVFGAGSGFTSTWFLRTDHNSHPCLQAGNMYASSKDAVATTVNISGGIIYGNVYGAGRGTDYYYTNYRTETTYWGDEAKSKGYTNLGQTYGSVVTNITGGTINGNVYGGGAGVAEAKFCGDDTYGLFTETAYLDGNATVTIGGNAQIKSYTNGGKTYGGNVYGGGMLAKVGGNTKIDISGTAQIEGNVFGAAQGITNKATSATSADQYISGTTETYLLHTADNAKLFGIVKGNTTVNIKETSETTVVDGNATTTTYIPRLFNNIYGGAESAITEGNTSVTINGGIIKDVYGGGLGSLTSSTTGAASADVYGNTTVTVSKASYFTDATNPENSDKADHFIYGGGRYASIIGKKETNNGITTTTGGSTTVNIRHGIAMDQTTVYGAGEGSNTQCENTNVRISKFSEQSGLSYVYGGGNQGKVNVKTNVAINGGLILHDVFGGGNEATVGTVIPESDKSNKEKVKEWAETYGTSVRMENAKSTNTEGTETEEISDAIVYGNVYGGGNKAPVYGNTNINVLSGNFGGEIFGGGKGVLKTDNTADISADVHGNTNVEVNGSIVIWNKKWDGTNKKFIDWNGENTDENFFTSYTEGSKTYPVFKNNHNVYGGGNMACAIGTYNADGTIIPETGVSTVTVKKGFCDKSLLSTTVWKNAYNDNTNPHFYVFGGGYGAYTKVGTTYVNVGVSMNGEVVETAETDQQLAKPRKTTTGAGTDDASIGVYDNSYGIPDYTVLGVIGGGYAGLVQQNTFVNFGGDTYTHRIFGGGYGQLKAYQDIITPDATLAAKLGEVGGYTVVEVNGGKVYGDIFGGGAGVESTGSTGNYTDYVDMGRVHVGTAVTVSGTAKVYGNVYGGGDVANVGEPNTSTTSQAGSKVGYGEGHMPVSVSTLDSEGNFIGYTAIDAHNTVSFVNVLGGNIYGMVFAGGNGRKKAEANDYTKLGRIEGNTLVHVGNEVLTDDEGNKTLNETNTPYIWNRIYGGGSYGTVDGNTLVHIEGGFLGYNIFGGGFGDASTDQPETAEANRKGTYANVLGNTKVQIDGGTWLWDRKADLNGNITKWEHANDHLAKNARTALAAMLKDDHTVDVAKVAALDDAMFSKYELGSQTDFFITTKHDSKPKHPHFAINHNIYGGGNAACIVGTFNGNGKANDNTGTAVVELNHSPMSPFKDGDTKVDILDISTVGGYCWYRSISAVEHPQFSVFGGGYGPNTKVANTEVYAQPGPRYDVNGDLFNLGTEAAPNYYRYSNQNKDAEAYMAFEEDIFNYYAENVKNKDNGSELKKWYGSIDGTDTDYRVYLRYRASQLAFSTGAPNCTFMDIHGGGYSGYVTGNTKVVADHELACRNIFGGGLGSLPTSNISSALTYGEVGGNTDVLVRAGNVSLNIFGGGAGVESAYIGSDGKVSSSSTAGATLTDFPNIARVKGRANVDVYGETVNRKFDGGHENGYGVERTLIFGGIYGGGDVANVGTNAASAAKLTGDDGKLTTENENNFTTSVRVWGASTLSQIYAGGNGRLKSECADYTQLGSVYGNTRFMVKWATNVYPYDTSTSSATGHGTLPPFIWNRIYGGCNKGTVYGNTFVDLESGYIAYNVFGGGWGNISTVNGEESITYANVTGNTHVLLNGAEAKVSSLWIPESRTWTAANFLGSQQYSPQYDPVAQKFVVNHNVYGGGNLACKVGTYNSEGTCTDGGETYITMQKGMLKKNTEVLAGQNMTDYNFFATNEWKEMYEKVGSPHFCVFGGGYGENTLVNNTNLDIKPTDNGSSTLPKPTKGEEHLHFQSEQSAMDIVGGGYSGKVLGSTNVNVSEGIFARRIFGGGFYNSANITNVNVKAVDCHDIFGGGLMGDVISTANVRIGKTNSISDTSDPSYSSTPDNSKIFIHGNIYGGNDVAGYINISLDENGYFLQNVTDGGTKIKIYGGNIDGDVYGAGNGDYLYALDRKGNEKVTVNEDYRLDETDENSKKFPLVYTVPMRETMASPKSASDAQKLVNINSWRPLTNRTDIEIKGADGDPVTIKGDVYGGGNTATVLKVFNATSTDRQGGVSLDIGSYVNIGRVFMGSNGDELFAKSAEDSYLNSFQLLNDIKLDDPIDWERDPSNHAISTLYLPTENEDRPLIYPHLLDLYFQPVEMDIQGDLKWAGTVEGTALTACTIGTFCCGGNRGNMNVYPPTEGEKKGNVIDYYFPAGLTIKDAIIGGCNNANYEWLNKETQNKIYHEGGYLLGEGHSTTPYIKLTVKNQFDPASNSDKGYLAGNVFGGCYESGTVRGDITVDFHSDMLRGKSKETLQKSYETSTPALSVYGAGYGESSYVYGDVNVLFGKDESITADPAVNGGYYNSNGTSAHFVYGGGQKGNVIGLTNVDIFNGHVAKAVTGGSYSGYVWGSTQVKVGYPTYYKLKAGQSGRYLLNRTDINNTDKKNKDKEGNETSVIKQYVCLLSGDIVSPAVYEAIYAKYNGENAEATAISTEDKSSTYFTTVNTPLGEGVTWDNIRINIDEAIYGGGYSVASGSSVMANNTTVLKLTDEYNIDEIYKSGNLDELVGGTKKGTSAGFAGNTTILVADATSKQGETDRDHITVSHQEMKPASIAAGTDLYGYYYKGADDNYHYIYQAGTYYKGTKMPENAKKESEGGPYDMTVYQFDAEGGIFGDGHLSYAEGFRNADIRGYGYASSTVANPKKINTFQRLDLVRLTDNCFTLLGARDYTVNEISTTPYSIARVGEVQMISSINDNNALPVLYTKTDDGNGNITTSTTPNTRYRNFMGFSNNIHYVGAVYSNVDFNGTTKWHNAEGKLAQETDKFTKCDGTGDVSLANMTYEAVKQAYIDDYYDSSTRKPKETANFQTFQYRNDGTAKNMIGIASGYALKIQNVTERYEASATNESASTSSSTKSASTAKKLTETLFYGPIYGVVEMNLIDVREDEGGGYVYADNIHSHNSSSTTPGDITIDKTDEGIDNDYRQSKPRKAGDTGRAPDFLEITGNFVFPFSSEEGRHVVDDCFPAGYNESVTLNQTPEATADIHYWYVTGFNYFYNAHITGYTYKSHGNRLEFHLDNGDNLMTLAGAKADQVPVIYSITWRSGHTNDYKCDLEDRNKEGSTEKDASGNNIVTPIYYTQEEIAAAQEGDAAYGKTTSDIKEYDHGYVLGISAANNGKYQEEDAAWYHMPFSGITHDDNNEILMQGKLPTALTSDAGIGIRLTDNVNNQGTQYYNEHLSKPCEATIILTVPALETYDDNGETKTKRQLGYIGVLNFYTKTTNNSDGSVTYTPTTSITGITSENAKNGTYYYYNSVLNRYSPITDLGEIYQKDGDEYKCVHTKDSEGKITKYSNINITSGGKTYYYKTEREYTYTIYLTIDYVQGPEISGNITVHNCALPGEMVRVSKEKVNIESDISFAPDGYYWRLGKRVKDNSGEWVFEDQTAWTKTSTATGYDVFNESENVGTKGLFKGCNYLKTENCLDIPAYYFMNGYGIQLGVSMNGLDGIFPVTMTEADQMVVHNFHRMKPNTTTAVNLHLAEAVARAKAEPTTFAEPRIYLSTANDLKEFVNFIDTIGTGKQKVNGTETTTGYIDGGVEKVKIGSSMVEVPRYGANAQFVVQNDLTIPDGYDPANYGNPIFAGTMHGEGHVVKNLATGKSLITTNNGHIYNLGMASGKIAGSNSSISTGYSDGKYHCCFEYAPVSPASSDDFNAVVYRMNGDAVITYTEDDFKYGKVAYDLNQYYLTARQLLAGYEDTHASSIQTKANATSDASIRAAMSYIHDYWANGDYQYARRNDTYTNESTGVTYLRIGSDDDPNYGEYLTRHDKSHPVDIPRAVYKTSSVPGDPSDPSNLDHYLPLFNSTCQTTGAVSSDPSLEMNDYIYWGQNLQPDIKTQTWDAYPVTIASLQNSAMSNRVYRAVGYYGNTTPDSYHYNAYEKGQVKIGTYVHVPTTTAIDFTCYADGESPTYVVGYPETTGTSSQNAYYPPFKDEASTYSSFNIDGTITRNLLVYTEEGTEAANEAADVVATRLPAEATVTDNGETTTTTDKPEKDIFGHHIVGTTGNYSIPYFHLVERNANNVNGDGVTATSAYNNDFCCPISFSVTDRAWYTRKPLYYAEAANDAWEGICLPFTVNKAVASINGEITHFYGTAPDNTDPEANCWNLHHEYWLRGLTAVQTEGGTTSGMFQRPGLSSTSSSSSSPSLFTNAAQTTAKFDYEFSNDFFYTAYGSRGYNYSPTQNDWYHKGDAVNTHTYSGYLPLTSSIPYIVSFPGNRYYEFDLSSKFYNVKLNENEAAQTVTFNAYGTESNITIPVTADMRTSVNSYNHTGTFMAIDDAAYGMNSSGTAFDDAINTVLPFRTYMTVTQSGSSAKTRASDDTSIIYIAGDAAGIDEIEPETIYADDPEASDDDYIKVYPAGKGRIGIESTYATTLRVYTMAGQLYRILDVRPGTDTYSGFQTGIYIVGNKKVRVQ